MAEAIFLDVLPKFAFAAMEAGLAKFKSAASEGGKEIGVSLSAGTNGALEKLQADYTQAATAATEASRAMVRANQQVEISTVRLSEVTARYGEASSNAMRATLLQSDAEYRAATAADAHAAATERAAAAQAQLTAATGTSAAAAGLARTANIVGAASFAAFTVAAVGSTNAAADFQQTMVKLQAAADETPQGLKVVSDGILKLAGDVGYSANELGDAMYGIEKQGYRAAEGVQVMGSASQLAKIEGADLKEVVQGLTVSMHDFGYTADQSADVASKLKVAVGASGDTLQNFTGALHSVEPAAAAANIRMEDVYATLAEMTKSGMSADQAAQNMNNSIVTLSNAPNVKGQRDAMAQFGISADDVSQKLGQRGLIGTMQMLSEAVGKRIVDGTNVSVPALQQNAQAAQTAANMLELMSPAAAAQSQAFANGSINVKEYTADIRKSSAEDAARMTSFKNLEIQLDGFSKQYRNGTSLTLSYNNALKQMVGTIPAMSTALQVTGEHTDEVNGLLKELGDTTADSQGNVKGFSDVTETMNFKLDAAKDAFHSATIELGNSFLPTMTSIVNAATDVAKAFANHPDVLRDVTYAVGLLGGAWIVTKGAMAIGSLVSTIATGMTTIGGFVWGLTGKYGELAISANAAADAEARAASGGAFAKGGAAGAGVRGAAGVAGAALPLAGLATGFALWGNDFYDSHDDGTSNTDAIARGRGGGRTGLGQNKPAVGPLPIAAADQYARPGAEAERRGVAPKTTGDDPVADVTGAAAAARPDITEPGFLSPDDEAAKKKAAKSPAGSRDDPIWISPGQDAKKGESADVYNPFAQFQTGGFTPASLVGFAVTFALNQALGNPYGKMLAQQKRGETAQNPLYVTNVDVENAQTKLQEAIQNYGPDSTQARTASDRLQATQASVGTTGGYYDPRDGSISQHDRTALGGSGIDAALLANVTPGKYVSEAGVGDLTKGIGDCTSSIEDLVDMLDGNSTAGRSLSTGNASSWLPAHGFLPGEGGPGDFRVGYNDHHMQATLPEGTPFNYGSDAAAARRGIGGTGADDPAFTQHYYRPVTDGAVPDMPSEAGGYPPAVGRQPTTPAPAPAAAPSSSSSSSDGSGIDLDNASLGDLRSLLFGGGGESPLFKRSPAPAPAPALPRDGAFGRGAASAPRTPGGSLFAPGGILSAPAPRPRPSAGGNDFGGIGMPGVPGGLPPGQIGPFPAPASFGRAGAAAGAVAGGATGTAAAAGANQNLGVPGGGRPARGGTGKGGGTSIGSTAAAIAGPAIDAFAPGASIAAQKGGQLLDRAIGYAGQLAGIGISGLFETFGLNDSALADPSHSLIGRLAGGLAGAHKTADNTAGQSTPPLAPPDKADPKTVGNQLGKGGQQGPLIGTMNVTHSGDADGQRIATDVNRGISSVTVGQTRGTR